MFHRQVTKAKRSVRQLRHEYPRSIWTMTGGAFINSFGGSMVFPIFTLYFTQKFGLSLAEAGLLGTLFVVGGLIGGPLGGHLTDRIGRKGIMIFSLCAEATFSMGMALAPTIPLLLIDIVLFGLTTPMFQPASAATIADLVPSNRRAASFGLMRIAHNAGVAIGPVMAGVMLAVQRLPDGSLRPNAYLPLFVADAVTSLIFAWIIAVRLRETKPKVDESIEIDQPLAGSNRSGGGYGQILRDNPYVMFVLLSSVMSIVYAQMNTNFSVYMKGTYGVPEEHYALMLASNALMVVLFQFPIARWVDQRDRSSMLALGAALYAIGFGLIGFVATGVMFEVAVIILTLGEMVLVPASQTVAADLAPIDMRGRYQAVLGLMMSVGYGIGPVVGGLLYDRGAGHWIWYASLIIGLGVAFGFRATGSGLRAREEEIKRLENAEAD
jgi:MFS family permease